MRQWVLVTSWDPLTIFLHRECYIRFAVSKYDHSELAEQLGADDWEDKQYVHLVNNSISKHSSSFSESFEAEDGTPVREHMWSQQDFAGWLQHTHGATDSEEVFAARVRPRIEAVARDTLRSFHGTGAQEHAPSGRCYEIYGFDFMLDTSLNLWLIEINSSPAIDDSTTVTKKFLAAALRDSLKVVLDWSPWAASRLRDRSRHDRPRSADVPEPETGGWCLLHRDAPLTRPKEAAHHVGMKLGVEGRKLEPPGAKREAALAAKRQARHARLLAEQNRAARAAAAEAKAVEVAKAAEAEAAAAKAAEAKLAEVTYRATVTTNKAATGAATGTSRPSHRLHAATSQLRVVDCPTSRYRMTPSPRDRKCAASTVEHGEPRARSARRAARPVGVAAQEHRVRSLTLRGLRRPNETGAAPNGSACGGGSFRSSSIAAGLAADVREALATSARTSVGPLGRVLTGNCTPPAKRFSDQRVFPDSALHLVPRRPTRAMPCSRHNPHAAATDNLRHGLWWRRNDSAARPQPTSHGCKLFARQVGPAVLALDVKPAITRGRQSNAVSQQPRARSTLAEHSAAWSRDDEGMEHRLHALAPGMPLPLVQELQPPGLLSILGCVTLQTLALIHWD